MQPEEKQDSVKPPAAGAWTPGPWQTYRSRSITNDSQEWHIGDAWGPTKEQADANAYLMAAAPELYEALAAIVAGEPGPMLLNEDSLLARWERGKARFENARAALRKARGESFPAKPDEQPK